MVLVLEAAGIPTQGIGLIMAVDWFLDRCVWLSWQPMLLVVMHDGL